MTFRLVKFMLLVMLISSCEEETYTYDDTNSNLFGVEGRIYQYHQLNSSNWPVVTVQILPNSVATVHYLEYYSKLLDENFLLDSFDINFGWDDLNYFVSSSNQLQKNAIITLPFPYYINWNILYFYRPYKVKITGETNNYDQLNDPANWTLISNYTVDNTAKTISFETDDLNALYVIAKHL